MFRPRMMACTRPVRMTVTSGCGIAMHWAWHDGNRGPAQCRHPGREEGDEQVNREQSAHHAANLRLANQLRFTKQCEGLAHAEPELPFVKRMPHGSTSTSSVSPPAPFSSTLLLRVWCGM